MSKNKQTHRHSRRWATAVASLLAHALCFGMVPSWAQEAPKHSQNIAEFMSQSPDVAQPNGLPKPLAPWPLAAASTARTRGSNMDLQLVGIYGNKNKYIAEFNIGGNVHYLELADRIKEGWRIARIDPQSVDISRCTDKKPCQTKTLHLEAQ